MSYTDIDFERHPMPASTRVRIRERMAGLRGAVAARKDVRTNRDGWIKPRGEPAKSLSIRLTADRGDGGEPKQNHQPVLKPGLPHHQALSGDDA